MELGFGVVRCAPPPFDPKVGVTRRKLFRASLAATVADSFHLQYVINKLDSAQRTAYSR